MSHYRIYSLTRDGHIKTVPVVDELDLEVWQGPRRVAVLKGKSAR
jgi:hypothetical protein